MDCSRSGSFRTVLGARFLFDFAFRAIATAFFEPLQQRQSPVCLLTICAFHRTDRARVTREERLRDRLIEQGDTYRWVGMMKLLLTSSGISNPSIHGALVDLLGKPIAESNALFIPTGIYPFPRSARMAYRAICGKVASPLCELGWKSLGVLPPILSKHISITQSIC